RARAAARRRGVPDRQGAERAGGDDRARRRAERERGAPDGRPRLRPRGRRGRALGLERGARRRRLRPPHLPGLLMASVESPRAQLGIRGGPLRAVLDPVAILLVAAAVALLVGSLRSPTFAELTVQGLGSGAVYGGLALALVLVYRATHVINFAQGELAMLTTYVAYQL